MSSIARLKKAPSRLLERMSSSWRSRRNRRSRQNSDSSTGMGNPRDPSSSSRGGGGRGGRGGGIELQDMDQEDNSSLAQDEPILSEKDHKELLSLLSRNISMDFILEMKEAFQLFDKNGDGFISAKELGVLMRTLGRNPTEDEILNIMNEIDIDHNGKLDFSEFTLMMRDKLASEDMEKEIKEAFRVFDRNGDGFISKVEFKHCMMHFGEQFTDEEVEEMIADADSNNDGKIDYTEFSQMILREINIDETSQMARGMKIQQQEQEKNNSY